MSKKLSNVEGMLRAIHGNGPSTVSDIGRITGVKDRGCLTQAVDRGYIRQGGKQVSVAANGRTMELYVYKLLPLGEARLAKLTAARLAGDPPPRKSRAGAPIVLTQRKKSPAMLKRDAPTVHTPDTIITRIPSRFSSSTYKVGDGERGCIGIAQ